MGRILEAIFRRSGRLLLLIIVLPVMSLAIAYFFVPRMYQSTASVWALQRYAIIGATGPETNLLATPADTQATALTELLQTHSFVQSVAAGINLAPTLGLSSSVLSDPQLLDDAIFQELSRNVQISAQSYNLFEVSYSNRNPVIAKQIVQSVVENFGLQSVSFSVVEGQRLLQNYETQLQNVQQAADNAAKTETQYIVAHPSEQQNQLLNDPQYALLDAKRQQAQATVQNIQNTIATLNQEISLQGQSASNLFQVLDNPQPASRANSRTKQYAIAGGIGLGLALAACVLYLLILLRRDRRVYTCEDTQRVTTFPVVMQLPHLKLVTVAMLTEEPAPDTSLLQSGTNGLH